MMLPEKHCRPEKRRLSNAFSFLTPRRVEKQIPDPENLTTNDLFYLSNHSSFVAEQYRLLRSYLFKFNKAKPLRTILITSTLPNEGKTVTAYNLAACIASSINEHVLLVDTDLRKPSLHKFFGLNPNGGLANYLAGEEKLPHFLVKTDIDKLTILPAGLVTDNPSELIASEKMKLFIQEVKSRYDDRFIIFDSSPLQQTTEPRIIAEQVDGIILVVASGQTHRQLVAKSVADLGKDKILGIVFNKSREKSKVSKYYYNYYYRGKK